MLVATLLIIFKGPESDQTWIRYYQTQDVGDIFKMESRYFSEIIPI